MKETLQVLRVIVPFRDGEKFSMRALVGREDDVELVLKSDYDKIFRALDLLTSTVSANDRTKYARQIAIAKDALGQSEKRTGLTEQF